MEVLSNKPWDEAFRLRQCHPLDQVVKLEYLSFLSILSLNPLFIFHGWLSICKAGKQTSVTSMTMNHLYFLWYSIGRFLSQLFVCLIWAQVELQASCSSISHPLQDFSTCSRSAVWAELWMFGALRSPHWPTSKYSLFVCCSLENGNFVQLPFVTTVQLL